MLNPLNEDPDRYRDIIQHLSFLIYPQEGSTRNNG